MKKESIFKCIDCETATSCLEKATANKMLADLQEFNPDWRIENNSLIIELKFKSFNKPLRFVNEIAQIANKIAHHPDISFGWGYLTLRILTHKVSGLTETDFYLAEKISKEVINNLV